MINSFHNKLHTRTTTDFFGSKEQAAIVFRLKAGSMAKISFLAFLFLEIAMGKTFHIFWKMTSRYFIFFPHEYFI